MTKKKTTRRALLTSILSLMLCVTMLVGTTFAWFTDVAASGRNKIIAGNLDVELLYKNDGIYEDAQDVNLFDEIELWEPGMVAYETVKIANVGNLALKYALSINSGNENALDGHSLSEVLHFAVIDGEVSNGATRTELLDMADASANKGMLTTYTFGSGEMLNANTESDPMTLVVYWPENGETDNLYNANNGKVTNDGKPLHIDLGLTVFASQETVEEDSFDKYYDDTASYPENMWLGDVAETLVIDEETKTISIDSGAELAKLAEVVNAGTDYEGYTVKLTDNIDLANIAWTPIGTASAPLKADVDGQDYTIYNLNVSGGANAGLFGNIFTANVEDINVINATITGNHYLGAVVGYIYGSVIDCSVTNAMIIATPDMKTDNSGYDNGDKVAGIAGYIGEGIYTISGNKAENVYLKAYRDVAGIAGMVNNDNVVENNIVKNIEIVVDQATNAYGDKDFNAGGVIGRTADGAIVKTETNTEESETVISYVVATETALRSAIANGGSVTLGADITVDADNTITIDKDNEVNLDLNGYTLSGISDDADKNDDNKLTYADNEVMFDVRGIMSVENGTITIEHKDSNFEWNACTEVFYVGFNGTLKVENAAIENKGGSNMAYAIDMVNAATDGSGITVNVKNSTIKSSYIPVRVFNNGSGMNNVTIEDSNLEGVSCALWVQFYSNTDTNGAGIKDSTLNLNIYGKGNTFGCSAGKPGVIIYGFNDSLWLDSNGDVVAYTADTASGLQDILDIAKDNTTIYLVENVSYGDVKIRVNEDSELVNYWYVMGDPETKQNYSNQYGETEWQYAKRTINGLTIVGAEGAKINSLTADSPRNDDKNKLQTRNNMFEINDLTISGVTFTKGVSFNTSDVYMATTSAESEELYASVTINGLTMDGCVLNSTKDKETGGTLLGIANTTKTGNSNAKNIVVKNCTVDGAWNGLYLVDGVDILVENNTFKNIGFNSVHINNMCGGNIIVRNNMIEGNEDRVFRLNGIKSGEITFANNVITNSNSDGGQYLKASSMGENAYLKWDNNTADGVEIILSTTDDGVTLGTIN